MAKPILLTKDILRKLRRPRATEHTPPERTPIAAKLFTPAMEAGITDHVWELEEIAGLTD